MDDVPWELRAAVRGRDKEGELFLQLSVKSPVYSTGKALTLLVRRLQSEEGCCSCMEQLRMRQARQEALRLCLQMQGGRRMFLLFGCAPLS